MIPRLLLQRQFIHCKENPKLYITPEVLFYKSFYYALLKFSAILTIDNDLVSLQAAPQNLDQPHSVQVHASIYHPF